LLPLNRFANLPRALPLSGPMALATASLVCRGTGVGEVVLVQPNGQPFQTMLARFTFDGVLDTTFGTQGIAVATGSGGCTALAQLSNGNFLVGDAQAVAEFTASGSVASTITPGTIFASNGIEPSTPSVFQPNGDYLFGTELFVGEESRVHNSSAEVLRFTETGAADASPRQPSLPLYRRQWIGDRGHCKRGFRSVEWGHCCSGKPDYICSKRNNYRQRLGAANAERKS
jgi:hypothetical protein